MTEKELELVEETHTLELVKIDLLQDHMRAAMLIFKQFSDARHELLIEKISTLQKNDNQESSGNNND